MKKFLPLISLLVFSLIISPARNVAADDAQKIAQNLQGTWVSIWSNASSCKIDEKVTVTFKQNVIEILFQTGVDPDQHTFKIIPGETSEKGGIDLILPPAKKGTGTKICKGTYILKQDTLILILPNAGEPRTKNVQAAVKADSILFWVLAREKSKAKSP